MGCAGGFGERCETYLEAYSCIGTGCASCEFLWRRGETHIEIRTEGELDPPVVGTECLRERYGEQASAGYNGGVRCRTNCP